MYLCTVLVVRLHVDVDWRAVPLISGSGILFSLQFLFLFCVLCFVITSVMLTAFFLSLEQRHEGQTFGA